MARNSLLCAVDVHLRNYSLTLTALINYQNIENLY